jgi:hypothetical protein
LNVGALAVWTRRDPASQTSSEKSILAKLPTGLRGLEVAAHVPPSYGVAMMRGAARVKRSWAFMRALAPKNVKKIPEKEKRKKNST